MVADIVGTGLVATGIVFVIGLLVGVIIKKAISLGLVILGLLIVLAATGYITTRPGQFGRTTIQYVASTVPAVTSQAVSIASILPIASVAFIIGLAIGIWKG